MRKEFYHSGKRAAEKAPLKNFARSYNNGENLEDYNIDIETTRTRFHNGWWD